MTRYGRFDWALFLGVLAFVIVVGGVIALVWVDVATERRQCHEQGGHMVSVSGSDVCVNRDNQVIFL